MIEALSGNELVFICSVLTLAYAVKGASSFGPSLIAVPMLTAIWPHPAVFLPSLALLNLSGNVLLLSRFFRAVEWKLVGILSLGTAVGVPVGIALLETLSATSLQLMLAAGILGTLPIALGKRPGFELKPGHGFVAGCLSGVLGGSIGIDGPPYVIFLSALMGDDNEKRYATTIATFTIGCSVRATGFFVSGHLTGESAIAFLWGLPLMAVGIGLGVLVFRRLSRKGFDRLVAGVLLATVVSLVVRVGSTWA